MEASSEQEILSLLHAAQCNSSSWTSDQNGQMRPVPNRAHLFVRIVLYNAVQQQMSTLHVVDLAGSQSISDYQGDCSGLKHQEKLAINQQLLSLSKFISELSRLSTSQGELLFYLFFVPLNPAACRAAKDRQYPASNACMGTCFIDIFDLLVW